MFGTSEFRDACSSSSKYFSVPREKLWRKGKIENLLGKLALILDILCLLGLAVLWTILFLFLTFSWIFKHARMWQKGICKVNCSIAVWKLQNAYYLFCWVSKLPKIREQCHILPTKTSFPATVSFVACWFILHRSLKKGDNWKLWLL